MNKLLLIDGNSILNRAFYALPDLTTRDGRHTNAVLGFLNIIFKVIDEDKATHVCVAFDVKHPTFRHEMYKEYKGTRKPMPQELREQLPLIKEVLKSMNIFIVEKAGYEADDILGTLSRVADRNGYEVSVLSGDRDLLQLATDRILIRIPKTKGGKTTIENYHAKEVEELYGVDPVTFIDMKGLMGDSSDNIPGVTGIGEKTAAKLLLDYGSIEGIYASIDKIKAGKMKDNLIKDKELAFMSKELATIKLDCDIPSDLEDMKLSDMYNEASYKIFSDLELKSYLGRFSETSQKNEMTVDTEIIDDLGEYTKLISNLRNSKHISFKFLACDMPMGIAVTDNENKVYIIPFVNFITYENVKNDIEELYSNISIVSCESIKDELAFIDIDCDDKIFDAGVSAYLLNPLRDNYDYDDIAKEYLDIDLISPKELLGKKKMQEDWYTDEAYRKYCFYITVIPFMARDIVIKKLSDTDMLDLYKNIELPCVFALYDMEKNGIRVDGDGLRKYGEKLRTRIDELQDVIYKMAGREFNINSPKQLGEILFEELGLKSGKKTKTGYSTSVEVLEKLSGDHEIIPCILEYRQLTKLNSTYVEGLSQYIASDGRIHGKFNQTVTATGRISSTEPNLQNIPTRYPLGREIRKVFVPEDGYVFLDADYSQIELRVLAHMSGDKTLISAYNKDTDIHAITASEVFGVPMDKVDSLMRRRAKAVNFGIVYGISSFGLGQDLDVSRKEAEQYINKYFETYTGVKNFLDETVKNSKQNGYSVTLFNRRRPIPELASSNFMTRSFGERVAMNSPIQGTAADIIKIAMINVNNELKCKGLKSRLILQVHDELLIETKKEEIDEVKQILHDNMMNAAELQVPLIIDMNEGINWYEAK